MPSLAWTVVRAIVVVTAASLFLTPDATAEDLPSGAFGFELGLTLPGTPAFIYDNVTGDISGWWDHTMSEHPVRLEIEPRPGGGFWEIFDASGDGIRHAVVTYAKRGEMLRFEGPLGLTGHALDMVTTYALAPAGADSTRLTLTVRGAGEVDPRWPVLVEQTWRHFLFERLQPYVAAGGRQAGR
jgi:hypothetical protein